MPETPHLGGLNPEQLEATLCAYTAAYLDMRGPEDCAYLGDLRDGYVLIPTSRVLPGQTG